MGFNAVKNYFAEKGLLDRVHLFEQSSATVALAAAALGCKEQQIAKTLSFSVRGKPIVIATAGDAKIDNAKFREYFHEKARMIPFEEVESAIGHPVGGVCPFLLKEEVSVYLDISLKRFCTIYPACGSDHSAVELSPIELSYYSNSKDWIDVSKMKEENN